jgi:CheY-like chemotaxis protein
MTPKPILIVEDEPDGQELVSRLLSQRDIPISVAGDVDQAWHFLMNNDYAAAIIDLALPEHDGFELLNYIRQQPELSHLPCMAITAFHTPELKQRAMRDGFDAYLSKPLDRARFLGELDRVLTG